MNHDQPASILLVDDNTNNLWVLYRYLDDEGFTVLVSQDGERALLLAREQRPDLVLLDVMLPGINGFQICERLKAEPVTADIPVIFISALTDVQDKVRGFRAGGVDYVTKPFQQEEVLARIRAHITIKRQREELDRLNATKDRLFSVISHDLRGPFMGLLGALELLRDSSDEFDAATAHELIAGLYESAQKTYQLLENLLEWSRSQQQTTVAHPAELDLAPVVCEAAELFRDGAERKEVRLSVEIPRGARVYADRDQLGTVLRNLINNAVKFTPAGGRVEVSGEATSDSENTVRVTVLDTGTGIDPEALPRLFTLDHSVSTVGTDGERGSGLGLLLAHDYVTRNGGTISVQSEPGQGSRFTVSLPACAPTSPG